MRFLCLHGKGTNSRIFESQTAALRYRLGNDHTYDFVEGSIPCDAALEVATFSSSDDEFFAYFDDVSPASCRQALEDLEAYIKSAGPFDGLMAFSIGAVLGATLLVQRAQTNAALPFRLAVFFCGGAPSDPSALNEDKFRFLDGAFDGEVLHLPTAHVLGKNDPRNPSWGPQLAKLCSSQLATTFVHERGHDIPSWHDQLGLERTVQCIQRTIDRAITSH
ncbi:MAG: hypothetical protein Q9207_004327 [Kuettlingeria erythrocarpa]